MEELYPIITEDAQREVRTALGNEYNKCEADLAFLMKNIGWEYEANCGIKFLQQLHGGPYWWLTKKILRKSLEH